MKCTLLAIFAVAIAYVSAVSISNPIASTTWSFGKKWTVNWVDDPKRPQSNQGSASISLHYLNNIKPELYQDQNLIVKAEIPDLKSGKAEIDLTNVPTGKYPPKSNQYFIRIGEVGSAVESFSSTFTITGGTGAEAAPQPSGGSSPQPSGGSFPKPSGGAGSTIGTRPSSVVSRTTSKKSTATGKNASSDAVSTYTFSLMAVLAAVIAVFM